MWEGHKAFKQEVPGWWATVKWEGRAGAEMWWVRSSQLEDRGIPGAEAAASCAEVWMTNPLCSSHLWVISGLLSTTQSGKRALHFYMSNDFGLYDGHCQWYIAELMNSFLFLWKALIFYFSRHLILLNRNPKSVCFTCLTVEAANLPKTILLFYLSVRLSLSSICRVCVLRSHKCQHMREGVRERPVRVTSLLLPYGFWEPNSGCQA